MATLFLVRHGTIDGMRERLIGRADVGLNKQGRQEAMRAAEACLRLDIGLVVSSPRLRARETASIIADAIECRLEIADAFDEINYGRWSGKAFSELSVDPDWHRFNDDRDEARIPDGEGLEAVTSRIKTGLDTVAGYQTRGDVVVVTHAEIIRGALLLAYAKPWSSWSLYQPEPASITPVRWR